MSAKKTNKAVAPPVAALPIEALPIEVEEPCCGTGKFYYPSGATYEGGWLLAPEPVFEQILPSPEISKLSPVEAKKPTAPEAKKLAEVETQKPYGLQPPGPPPDQVRPNRRRHGKGIYIDGAYEYIGDWQDDCMHGQGCFKYASGSSYDGQWENNIYTGLGTYTWANGAKYIGEWRENKMHGIGQYVDKDGNLWNGQFFNGTGPGLIMEIQL